MTDATSKSELERLLAWQLPRCKKSGNAQTEAVTATLTLHTAATAPPPTAYSTVGTTAGDTFPRSESYLHFAPPETLVEPEDVLELSELHLADDLLLRNVIHLPALAKYSGMMCEASLAENTRLPDLESSHSCGSRARGLPSGYQPLAAKLVADKRDVQVFCRAREVVAATAASAFLNSSPSAWDQCHYLVWKDDPNIEEGNSSVQSYLSVNRQAIPAGLDLFQGLLAAEEFGLTPFVLYCYTEPELLKDTAKCFEHIGTHEEKFSWTHCSPQDNTSTHHDFPRSGRTAGPDSTLVRDIVTQIKSNVANRGGHRPRGPKMLLAGQLMKKVWTKLVAINGTFAIVGDGQYEMICMRHRHLQTLFISPCHDVTRDPYDRTMPSPMRVRIGLNIIATLDLVWRATLWRNAAQIGIQVPTMALSRHLTTFMTADSLAQQLRTTKKVRTLWMETPVLLKYVARREQPLQSAVESVVEFDNHSDAIARDIGQPLVVSMNEDVVISPDIYVRGVYRTELNHPPEAGAYVWGLYGASIEGGQQRGWTPLIVQMAFGDLDGKRLEAEFQHRLRISNTSAAAILPQLYGIFRESANIAQFLLLEDIGMQLREYLDYLSNTFPKSRLLGRIQRLDEELRDALNRLHATGHTHGALLSMSDVLVALDHMGSFRLVFKNLHEMQFWPSHGTEETKYRDQDLVRLNVIVQDMYMTCGLSPPLQHR